MSILDDLAARPPLDVAAIFRQTFNGLYNSQGRQVGSFESLDKLCRGQWLLFKGETSPGNANLYVKEITGRLSPVVTMCYQANQAATFATPQQKAAQEALVKNHGGQTPFVSLPNFTLPSFDVPDLFGDAVDAGKANVGKIAIVGGLALLGVVVLMGKR